MGKSKYEIVQDQSRFHLVRKKKSKIHGFGLFATQKINKNTKIVQYTGQKIPRHISDRREVIHQNKGQLWIFELNRNWNIDANVQGGIAKFVNHDSKKPNCYVDIRKGEIWYRAAKTIRAKQELTVDYGTEPPDPVDIKPKKKNKKKR